ncbi:MAG: DUF349 domain-containing protein [Cytophagales bacterium]|nr:DUF349 domain-containing protein [Cytophagales bacterium]
MKTHESPFGYVEDGKVYQKGFLDIPNTLIGEVVDNDDETSIKYFEQRFEKVQQKVEEVVTAVNEATNKGSFLMRIVHLKGTLKEPKALGDYNTLYLKLEGLEEGIQKQVAENRERNLLAKQALLDELKEIVEVPYVKESLDKVKDVQSRWIRVGKVSGEEQKLQEEYQNLTDGFFKARKELSDAKKQVTEQRLQKYQSLISEAKSLLEKGEFDKDAEDFKQLQKDWKEVGFVNKNALNDLWKTFKETGNKFFEGLKSQKKVRRKSEANQNNEAKNEKKRALLEEAQTFFETEVSPQLIDRAKVLQRDWKAIGYTPNFDEEYDAFSLACNYVFEYQYLTKFVQNRDKDYPKRNEEERKQRLIKGIRTLIQRDKEELERYQDNVSSMTILSSKSSFEKVLDTRLGSLEKKLATKRKILEVLKK